MVAQGWRSTLDPRDAAILTRYRKARSEAWKLDRPALLVVDVVESFVGPDLPVEDAQAAARTACGVNAWASMEHIVGLRDAFYAARWPVAFSTIATDAPPSGAGPAGGNSDELRNDVLAAPLLPMRTGELVVAKSSPSAFFGTRLLSWLISRDVRSLVIAGCTTSGCVRASVVDGFSLSFDIVVPEEACFDRVQLVHDVNLVDMDTKYCRVVTCSDVIDRLVDRA